MNTLYYIEIVGCDDSTPGVVRFTTEDLAKYIDVSRRLNMASTYSCMPTIHIYKIDESFIRPASEDDIRNAAFMQFEGHCVALSKPIWVYKEEASDFGLEEGVEQVL